MTDFQKLIEDIRERADIIQIIGEHVNLEKHGSSFIGLCPFHDDKNPSMSVSPTKKIFKCFSCNASGNVITFIEKYKKISFIEALREVGQSVGIDVLPTQTERATLQNKKYYDVMDDATQFYQFYLKNTKEGQDALTYLYQRHLNADIINRFKIGLSSSNTNDLYQALVKREHLPADMLEVGIIKSGNDYYDTFRKRIMFPISDLQGRIVGFSGRIYTKTPNEPKYVNSNENIIFKKSQILYHYHEAFQEIKRTKKVYLFEGFMDVIAAYRAGISNTVASMGTALTNDQIKAIQNIANHIVICYDGDQAGIDATKRAISMCVSHHIQVSVAAFPEGLDPDEFINRYGKDKLHTFLQNNTINAIDFLYQQNQKNLVLSDIASVEHFKNDIFLVLLTFNSSVMTEKYIKQMATDLNISVTSLMDDFSKIAQSNKPQTYLEPPTISHQPSKRKTNKLKKYEKLQQQFIAIALQYPEKIPQIEHHVTCFDGNYDFIMYTVHSVFQKHDKINANTIREKLEAGKKGKDNCEIILKIFDDITRMSPLSMDDGLLDKMFEEYSKLETELVYQEFTNVCKDKHEKTDEDFIQIINLKKNKSK